MIEHAATKAGRADKSLQKTHRNSCDAFPIWRNKTTHVLMFICDCLWASQCLSKPQRDSQSAMVISSTHECVVGDILADTTQAPEKKSVSLTRAHALAQREQMKYPWEITTLSKSWARSSSKLNYEQASSLTEAQATAPNHAPIRTTEQETTCSLLSVKQTAQNQSQYSLS